MEGFGIPEYQTPEFFLTMDELLKPLSTITTKIRNLKREPSLEQSRTFSSLLSQLLEHAHSSLGQQVI